MREFNFVIDKEDLSRGLRSDFRDQRNTFSLEQCQNLRAVPMGLASYEPIILPFSGDELNANTIEWDWPYPMIFKGRNVMILATRRRLFYVNENDWSLQQIMPYDAATESLLTSIPAGSPWSFVDFGYSWFMFNGSCAVFRLHKDEMFGGTEKVLIDTNMRIETGCSFKGRLLTAGFDAEHNWSSDWQDFWEAKADDSGLTFDFSTNLRENFVHWSCIGGGDLIYLFSNGWAQTGYITTARGAGSNPYGSSRPLIYELYRRNDTGFMPLSHRGRIRSLKPFGDFVIAYGDNGVSALVPATFDIGSGFGEKKLLDVGIANTGAVAGDEYRQLFLDQHGELWLITAQEGFKKLGYQEYFQPLLGEEPIISYDPYRRDFYIGNNNKCYLLTISGLTEITQKVTSAIYSNGVIYGIGSEATDLEASLTLSGLDHKNPGIKTVTQLGFSGQSNADGYAGIYYRHNMQSSFGLSSLYPLNDLGTVTIRETGTEYKPYFKFDNFENLKIDSLQVSVQFGDNRFNRGVRENN